MQTAREKITEIVLAQPADATYDEIVRELAFVKMIERGLDDARAGLLVSNEEIVSRIDMWN